MPGQKHAKPARKRLRLRLDTGSDEDEAQVVAAVGFPRDQLLEEEIEAGVVAALGGVEQRNYMAVRIHIFRILIFRILV